MSASVAGGLRVATRPVARMRSGVSSSTWRCDHPSSIERVVAILLGVYNRFNG